MGGGGTQLHDGGWRRDGRRWWDGRRRVSTERRWSAVGLEAMVRSLPTVPYRRLQRLMEKQSSVAACTGGAVAAATQTQFENISDLGCGCIW
ncbi:hypothetical protein GUJ93_ZPchr0003g16748 [Zizania palustris]|uniref:Uncharacterized protein n=1 Tax=Zizania palustris TaxID=103762 RepID=A0A8J5VV50_ZIZPA|nr:hypothetical protein GUJ93_ZPchr0003g16748 [Zizania palustris]